jgi:hypothetical protein
MPKTVDEYRRDADRLLAETDHAFKIAKAQLEAVAAPAQQSRLYLERMDARFKSSAYLLSQLLRA